MDLQRQVLRNDFLGPGGTSPKKRVMMFSNLMAEMCGECVCSKRTVKGGLLKPNCYKSARSGLLCLCKKCRHTMPVNFVEELKDIMQGIKRTANEALQAQEGNIEDGMRPLMRPLCCQIDKWFVEDGSKEAVCCRGFGTATWNLCCRGDSTG